MPHNAQMTTQPLPGRQARLARDGGNQMAPPMPETPQAPAPTIPAMDLTGIAPLQAQGPGPRLGLLQAVQNAYAAQPQGMAMNRDTMLSLLQYLLPKIRQQQLLQAFQRVLGGMDPMAAQSALQGLNLRGNLMGQLMPGQPQAYPPMPMGMAGGAMGGNFSSGMMGGGGLWGNTSGAGGVMPPPGMMIPGAPPMSTAGLMPGGTSQIPPAYWGTSSGGGVTTGPGSIPPGMMTPGLMQALMQAQMSSGGGMTAGPSSLVGLAPGGTTSIPPAYWGTTRY